MLGNSHLGVREGEDICFVSICPTLLLSCKIPLSYTERLGETWEKDQAEKESGFSFTLFLLLSWPHYNISGTPPIQPTVYTTSL